MLYYWYKHHFIISAGKLGVNSNLFMYISLFHLDRLSLVDYNIAIWLIIYFFL